MANIIVVGAPVCRESSQRLAKILNAKWVEDGYRIVYTKNTIIFNYGRSDNPHYNCQTINKSVPVQKCINKLLTFQILDRAGVRVPGFTTNRIMAQLWDGPVVVRKELKGAKNEGLEIVEDRPLPPAPLYTEYFHHKKEFRVVLFQGEIASLLIKTDVEGVWELFEVEATRTHAPMIRQCQKAAKALGIDYVGFDVVYNNSNDFVILEANSGPALTETVGEFIKQKLKG